MHPARSRTIALAPAQPGMPRMPLRLGIMILIAMMIAATLVLPAAAAPDPADTDPTPTRDLTEKVTLDLRTDPRKGLQVQGPVDWKAGRLTLGPGGSILQDLDLGAQIKLNLRLAFAPLQDDSQTSLTTFAYQIRDRGEFVVHIFRKREAGKTLAQIKLIDRDTPVLGEKRTRTLGTTAWLGDFPDGVWTFRHHFGLQIISFAGKRLAIGYADKEPDRCSERFPPADIAFFRQYGIGKPLDVSGWSIEQQGQPVACLEVSGTASLAKEKVTFVGPSREPSQPRDLIDRPGWAEQERIQAGRGHLGRKELGGDDEEKGYRSIRLNLGEHHPYYALALAGWGMQYHWAGQDGLAETLLRQAIEISTASLGPWHPDHALIVCSLARVYRDIGKFERAEALLAETSRNMRDLVGPGTGRLDPTQLLRALLDQDLGRFAAAETLLRQAAEASADAAPRERADALCALGTLEARIGEREKAGAFLRQAQEALEKEIQRIGAKERSMGSASALIVSLANAEAQRGWVLLKSGQQDAARELARAAFLGMCQFHSGMDPHAPGRFMGWDRPISNVLPNSLLTFHPMYRSVMISLAELFLALDDLFPACGCIQVLDLAPGQTHHDLAAVYRIMSKVREKSPHGAVTAFVAPDRVPERYKRDTEYELRFQNRTADPLIAPDAYWLQLAIKEYEQSVGREHPDTLDALKAHARKQWRSGGPGKAEATLREAWSRSFTLLDRVLPGLPEVQTYQFLEANRPPADLVLSLYRATGQEHARDAYEVVWRSKALATRQLMDRRQLVEAASERPDVARLADELQATRQNLARVSLWVPQGNAAEPRRRQLVDLSERKEGLERELARLSEPFRRARAADRTSVAELVRRLPAQTAVVDLVERWQWTAPPAASDPWPAKRRYDAFVLRPAQEEPGWSAAWLELGDADALDQLFDGWIAGVRPGGRPDRALAQQVRDRVWKPIEAVLGNAQTVLLVPDGRLSQVPWNALPGKRPDSYLIEDYALAQIPYGQFLAHLLDEPAPSGKSVLLVGGIDYGPGGKWPYLKGTAIEVEQLAKLRAGPETSRLVGRLATPSRLRRWMPSRRFIHLATHAEFLDTSPGRATGRLLIAGSSSAESLFDVTARNPLVLAKLVLAGANRSGEANSAGDPVGDGGFLTAEEVMGIDLGQTELVVLSACETGVGKIRSGEGAFSLQRAFHIAGSRAVVASLWAVDDRATQAMMDRFYRNLWLDRPKPPGKLAALREAQLWLLREGAKQLGSTQRGLEPLAPEQSGALPPASWAAFGLSGDWR